MRNPNQNQHLRGILMAVSGCIFWGASGIAGQYLLTDRAIPTYWLTGARLILSGLFLLGLDRILSGRNPCRIWREKRDRLPLVLFGTLGMLGTQYFYFATIKESNAAIATILQYLMAILIVLWVCLRERRLPRLREFWCTLAAVLGTVLIVTGGRWDSLAVSPKALVLGLLSAAAAALYTVQPRDMILRWGAPLTVGWGMIALPRRLRLRRPPRHGPRLLALHCQCPIHPAPGDGHPGRHGARVVHLLQYAFLRPRLRSD